MTGLVVSPRTAEEPMAFTRAELGRGAFLAWCTFMILLLGFFVVVAIAAATGRLLSGDPFNVLSELYISMAVIAYAGLVGGSVGFVAMLAGTPLAWLIGRALRRVRHIGIHLLSFTAFGALAGLGVAGIFSVVNLGALHLAPVLWLLPIMTAIAVPTGWWLTVRRARREELGLVRPRRRTRDADMVTEDAVRGEDG